MWSEQRKQSASRPSLNNYSWLNANLLRLISISIVKNARNNMA